MEGKETQKHARQTRWTLSAIARYRLGNEGSTVPRYMGKHLFEIFLVLQYNFMQPKCKRGKASCLPLRRHSAGKELIRWRGCLLGVGEMC